MYIIKNKQKKRLMAKGGWKPEVYGPHICVTMYLLYNPKKKQCRGCEMQVHGNLLKINNALIQKLMIRFGHNFAHVTTAQLSGHVQNCDQNSLSKSKVYIFKTSKFLINGDVVTDNDTIADNFNKFYINIHTFFIQIYVPTNICINCV